MKKKIRVGSIIRVPNGDYSWKEALLEVVEVWKGGFVVGVCDEKMIDYLSSCSSEKAVLGDALTGWGFSFKGSVVEVIEYQKGESK